MSRRRLFGGSMTALACFLAISALAPAATPLTTQMRSQILASAHLPGPNGKVMHDPSCITGRLSTVDRRWAFAYLTNSRHCVKQYGSAVGEGPLLRRSSSTSTDWKQVASISDNCSSRAGGAPNRVLRDLGCTIY